MFDAAHRLPQLDSKCANLHGHTWQVRVTIGAPHLSPDSTVVEFGTVKDLMRAWIDTHIDHATLLGKDDPLIPALRAAGCRVYEFGADYPDQMWPTAEAAAAMIAHHAHSWARAGGRDDVHVLRVEVFTASRNSAAWTTSLPGWLTTL
ncbi:6-pyruvoyl tetrahydropterin synthase family protein [Nonomuraea sp. NPDC059023]|uniref:6-pyruvoyl trahydropterin synthase family protein n=1 Tax=unclassified Nonomuraea TaxID=2593643 RepID=UPI0036BB7B86